MTWKKSHFSIHSLKRRASLRNYLDNDTLLLMCISYKLLAYLIEYSALLSCLAFMQFSFISVESAVESRKQIDFFSNMMNDDTEN